MEKFTEYIKKGKITKFTAIRKNNDDFTIEFVARKIYQSDIIKICDELNSLISELKDK